MADTSIEWADKVWNPVTGCSKVSAGCKHCYAEREWVRKAANPKLPKYFGRKFTDVRFHRETLLDPTRWRKPATVFVNSMSDLFHPELSDGSRFDADELVNQIFDVMSACPQHRFLVLTKRPERMLAFIRQRIELCARMQRDFDPESQEDREMAAGFVWPLPNVWLGVSVEDQATADHRIPLLLQTPAAVRFVSVEPMLGPVEVRAFMQPSFAVSGLKTHDPRALSELSKMAKAAYKHAGGSLVDWVICGGESGPGARPLHPDWARSLRDQCQAAGVPFFFKQWGEWHPAVKVGEGAITTKDGEIRPTVSYTVPSYCGRMGSQLTHIGDARFIRVGKKAAGRLLDGREWNEFPEVRP